MHVHSGGDLAAVLGVAIFAAVAYEAARGGFGYAVDSERRPPEMAPDRKSQRTGLQQAARLLAGQYSLQVGT